MSTTVTEKPPLELLPKPSVAVHETAVAAAEWFEKSREARRRAGDVVGLANASHNLGEAWSDQGRLEDAEGLLREARRIWRASKYTMGAAAASSGLGRTLGRLGSTDAGLALLAEATATFDDLGIAPWTRESIARQADVLTLGGRFEEALELAQRWLPEFPSDEAATAILRRVEGIALRAAGAADAARHALLDSLARAAEAGSDYEIALTTAELGRLPERDPDLRAGDTERAREIADRLGVDLARVMSSVPWDMAPQSVT